MELRTHHQALLRSALDHAARGWHVFPLRPGDKRPAFPDHPADRCTGRDPRCQAAGVHLGWEPRATVDPDRIRRAWALRPFNIGIACGPSKLVVVDLDMPKPDTITPDPWRLPGIHDGGDVFALVCEQAGQPFPDLTYTVTTGRGGQHLYYQHPDDGPPLRNTNGERGHGLGWLVDTRAHGGYVVAAGSTVQGRLYTAGVSADLMMLPGWLAERLAPPVLPPQHPVVVHLDAGKRSAYVNAAIRGSLTAITTATDGTLNRTLYGASVALGQLVAGGALNPGEAETLLLDTAVGCGHPPAGAQRTIQSGFRAGARRPRSVAA